MRGARIGSLQDEERAGGGAGNPGRRGAVRVSEELGKVVSKQVWKQRAARVVPIFLLLPLLLLSPNIRGESIRPSVVVPTPVSRGKGAQHGGDNKGMTLLLLLLLLYACMYPDASQRIVCIWSARIDDGRRPITHGDRR